MTDIYKHPPICPDCESHDILAAGAATYTQTVLSWCSNGAVLLSATPNYLRDGALPSYECNNCGYQSYDAEDFSEDVTRKPITPGTGDDDPGVQ